MPTNQKSKYYEIRKAIFFGITNYFFLKPLGHLGLTFVTFLVVLPLTHVIVVLVEFLLPVVIDISAEDCLIAIVPRFIV
jgi:hypothetical protein